MSVGSKLAGVVGWPVAHSLSPLLHRYWLEEHGIRGDYIALSLESSTFSVGLAFLQRVGFVGVNVTVPYKEAAFALAHHIDDAARLCGAVNLILFHAGGQIEGRNTDVAGLRASLAEEFEEECLKGNIAVILGAGGAARAAVLALDRLGVSEIRILSRNLSRARRLEEEMHRGVRARLNATGWPEWATAAKDASILLNATNAGMADRSFALDLSLDQLPQSAAVYDLVYNPLKTGLLTDAQARGHRAVNGLGMLMHQAVPAFAAFYGVTPAVTPALRARLEKALAP